MPTTAAIIAGTGASLSGIGTVAWTGSGNITASDDTYTTSLGAAAATTHWLVATNFNMSSIPADAIILGVTGTVETKKLTQTLTITAASFVVGNAVVGTQKTLTLDVTTSDAQYTIGSASDLWGYQITPALLQTSTTGWAVSMTGTGGAANARVDAMWLTVDYGYNGFRTRITSSTLSNRIRRPLMAIRS